MRIEVLGDECGKCRMVYDNVRLAVAGSPDTEVIRSNDPELLAHYGVRSLPGLVIDGQLVTTGKFLSVPEIQAFLAQYGGKASSPGIN